MRVSSVPRGTPGTSLFAMLATTNALFLRTPLALNVWSSLVRTSTGTWQVAVQAAAQLAHLSASAPCALASFARRIFRTSNTNYECAL